MEIKKNVKVIQCPEGHSSWVPNRKYCQQCGGQFKKVRVEVTVEVCPQCKKPLDAFSHFPRKFCTYCGEQLAL